MDDEKLRRLARDIVQGRVFTDRHLDTSNPEEKMALVRMVWPVLMFMTKAQQDEMLALRPGLLYEYFSEAGPRSTNGYPVFMSVRVVSQQDVPALLTYLKALEDAPDPLATVGAPS
jgi:hypothetical protein